MERFLLACFGGSLVSALVAAGLIGTGTACSAPGGQTGEDGSPAAAPEEPTSQAPAEPLLVYVGTYTRGESEGIYRFTLDRTSGALTARGVTGGIENPSFLALHPSGGLLYAVSEVGEYEGERTGVVHAFAIEPGTGALRRINEQPSRGSGPCHLVVGNAGKNVLVANYGAGSVTVLPIRRDGSLGPASSSIQHEGSSVDPRRQSAPNAHSVNVDEANRFAFVADLGLDKVLVYRFDPDRGTLEPHDPPSVSLRGGSGPRHFDFHPDGRQAYVINELASSVTALAYDAKAGVLREIQTISSLPDGFTGNNSTAEVQVHPTGRFLYGSNRGHDSIAVFAIDAADGTLRHVEHERTQGKTPRNFGIEPGGAFLLAANQGSDTVVVFRIDPETGALAPTGHTASVPAPVCLRFLDLAAPGLREPR